MIGRSNVRPQSLQEATKHLSGPDAGLHAGGTDLLGCLHDHVFDLKKVVSISGLKELKAFVAFGTSVRITGPKGSRTVPIEKFFVLPAVNVRRETVLQAGEIVTGIVLPPVSGIRSTYRKVRGRAAWDFAFAGMALAVRIDKDRVSSARAVLSGAAPIP